MRMPAMFRLAITPIALSLLCSAAANAQPDLDAIVKQVIAQEHVVGASVLVARGDKILLHQGYGFADLGLEVPTKGRNRVSHRRPYASIHRHCRNATSGARQALA